MYTSPVVKFKKYKLRVKLNIPCTGYLEFKKFLIVSME